MSWAEDKAREIGRDHERDEAMLTTDEAIERAIRETIAKCAETALNCARERHAQLAAMLSPKGPADQRHLLVVAKCSEAERIAEAITKLSAS